MAFSLEGKSAVITGAGQGIGRATAILFRQAGATVWAVDINQTTLESLALEQQEINVCVLDARDERAWRGLAAKINPIDILFNCAGYVHQGNILACERKDWDLSFDLNVTTMYCACRAFLPGMLKTGRGSIVNMASVVSSIKGVPNRCAYAASKAAVIGLTKAIAADYVAVNIRCNALCPGTVETPSLIERMAAFGDMESARKTFIARQPMGRLGKAEEIAFAALYLASDESAFLTGQAITIDGGWSI